LHPNRVEGIELLSPNCGSSTDLRPATLRAFQEVRPKVLEEWRRQHEDQTKALYLGRLREKYGVVIDDSVSPLLASPPAEAKTQ
jgi:hypothetical protein